jgi:hypothetical protein
VDLERDRCAGTLWIRISRVGRADNWCFVGRVRHWNYQCGRMSLPFCLRPVCRQGRLCWCHERLAWLLRRGSGWKNGHRCDGVCSTPGFRPVWPVQTRGPAIRHREPWLRCWSLQFLQQVQDVDPDPADRQLQLFWQSAELRPEVDRVWGWEQLRHAWTVLLRAPLQCLLYYRLGDGLSRLEGRHGAELCYRRPEWGAVCPGHVLAPLRES